MVLVAILLVALVVLVVLGFLFLPGACSRMSDGGNGEIAVTSTEGNALSDEQLLERAKDRFVGTWVIGSVTWQGEEGDGSAIPQKVDIKADGSCVISQGGADLNGKWEVDGDSLFVTAKDADGNDVTRVLSIDGTNLNITANNGTGVYVRTSKPDSDGGAGE